MPLPRTAALSRSIALLLAAAAPVPALAGELDYQLYGGIEHSDNIALTADHPISQNVLIPGVNFTYRENGAVLQANVAGNLEYRDYLGSRFADQTQTQLAGQADWTLLPGRLDLSAQDYAGIQPIDRLASNGPENLQQTNVLAAGPTLHFRLGSALRGQVDLRYIDSYAEKTKDFNSHRAQAAVGLTRDLNPTDQLSLHAEHQRVLPSQSATSPDYVRDELYGQYASTLARLRLDLVLGWSRLDFRGNATPTASAPMARLSVDYTITARSSFTVSAAREYSDAAQDMLLQQPAGILEGTGRGINVGNTTVDSQVYRERRIRAGYRFSGTRLTFALTPIYRKLGYLDDPALDQTDRGATVEVTWRVRPTVMLSAYGYGDRVEYDRLDRRDTTTSIGLDLARQWTPHWSAHLSWLRQHRHSDEAGQSFRENQLFLGVTFHR